MYMYRLVRRYGYCCMLDWWSADKRHRDYAALMLDHRTVFTTLAPHKTHNRLNGSCLMGYTALGDVTDQWLQMTSGAWLPMQQPGPSFIREHNSSCKAKIDYLAHILSKQILPLVFAEQICSWHCQFIALSTNTVHFSVRNEVTFKLADTRQRATIPAIKKEARLISLNSGCQ